MKKDYQQLAYALRKQYNDKYEEIIEERQEKEKTWRDGLVDGLKEASDKIGWTYDNIKSSVKSAFSSMTDALTEFITTGKASFSDLADSIISDIVRMQIEAAESDIFSYLTSLDWGGLFSSSDSSLVSSGQIGSSTGTTVALANGGVFNSPSLHQYANTVQTQPKMFAFAQGGVFAEAGPEAIMPLSRDSQGQLGVKAEGSQQPNVTVNVVNESGQQMSVTNQEQSFDAQGTIVTLWLDAFQRNKKGLRTALGG